jgi:hypothetical protein
VGLRIQRYRLVSMVGAVAFSHDMGPRLSPDGATYSVEIQIDEVTACAVGRGPHDRQPDGCAGARAACAAPGRMGFHLAVHAGVYEH